MPKSIPTIESYSPETFKAEIKAYKSKRGEETPCFELKLYINGNFAATVKNHGTGGHNIYHWENATLKAIFDRHIRHLISQGKFKFDFEQNDQYLEQLIEELELKKWCKKSTVIKLKTHKDGEYLQLGQTYSSSVKEYVVNKFGDELIEIINERFILA